MCDLIIWIITGRAVFTTIEFEKGTPLLAYGGELISGEEGENRDVAYESGLRYYTTFPLKGRECGECSCYHCSWTLVP